MTKSIGNLNWMLEGTMTFGGVIFTKKKYLFVFLFLFKLILDKKTYLIILFVDFEM